MIRVPTIIASIGDETRSVISNIDPGQAEDQSVPLAARSRVIASPKPGVIVSVNRPRLVALARQCGCLLRLTVRIGDFTPAGAPLFVVYDEPALPARGTDEDRERQAWDAAVCAHVSFDTERTTEQDVAFGFRQLVDIALQALSPAINAPTTATQAIDEMHDLLCAT